MCKENSFAKMEILEVQICRSTRQGLIVMPWAILGFEAIELLIEAP